MSQDHKLPAPTKAEKALYELYLRHDKLEQVVGSQTRMTYALLGVLEGTVDIGGLAKTFHNEMRIQNIKMKVMAAELEAQKQAKESSELILPK